MSKLRVESFTISIDGYGAGPNQDLQNPLGIRGPELMEWVFRTRIWRKMHGQDDIEARYYETGSGSEKCLLGS